jgi:hypothetical protein
MANTDRPQGDLNDSQALSGLTRLERPMVAYVIGQTSNTPNAAINKFVNRYGERAAGQLLSAYLFIFIGALWAIAAIAVMLFSVQFSVIDLCLFGLCGASLLAGACRLGSAKRSAAHRLTP